METCTKIVKAEIEGCKLLTYIMETEMETCTKIVQS